MEPFSQLDVCDLDANIDLVVSKLYHWCIGDNSREKHLKAVVSVVCSQSEGFHSSLWKHSAMRE